MVGIITSVQAIAFATKVHGTGLIFKITSTVSHWIPCFVLVVILLLTGIATYYVEATAKTQAQLHFESAVQMTWQVVARLPRHAILTQDNIQNRLDNYISLLRSGSGLFAASEQVTRDDFRAYIGLELCSRYPGIQGIGFTAYP